MPQKSDENDFLQRSQAEFEESHEFQNLSEDHKREAGAVIEFFDQYSRDYFDFAPEFCCKPE